MTANGHNHAEAFMIMEYFGITNGNRISVHIWNSRDGVTPFTYATNLGILLQHINFMNDRYAPNHKPKKNDLIWINYDEISAEESAQDGYTKLIRQLTKLKTDSPEKFVRYESVLNEMLSDKQTYIDNSISRMLYESGPRPRLMVVEDDWV